MYCIVPSLIIIFVMQTNSKTTITNQTLKIKYMLHTTNSLRQTLINGSKKLAFVIAMFLTVGVSSSFATPTDNMNDQVRASFRKDFSNAQLMNEEVTKQYTKLTLKMNEMVLYAFYAGNGDLLAVTRNIRTSQLPIKLLLQLKKSYND